MQHYFQQVNNDGSLNHYGNAVQQIDPVADEHQEIPKLVRKQKPQQQEVKEVVVDEEAGDIPWEEFDEKSYIDKKRCSPGQDCYNRNKFNQLASDNTKSNRHVPDTRNAQ